jgi:hypothetical protein
MRKHYARAHLWTVDRGRHLQDRLASERGQGTVEYVGLILLVSLLTVGDGGGDDGFQRIKQFGVCSAECRAA